MPTQSRAAKDEVSPIQETVEKALASIAITTQPVVIIGVNRKVNTGNFENIDVYAGIALPIPNVSIEDMDALKEAIEKVAEAGFLVASRETFKRYSIIKEAQNI